MLKKTQLIALALTVCGMASAQQSNVNLCHNPQKDTEGLIPFSASLNSPQVNDDHTVIFRIKAPQASEVKLSDAMLTVTASAPTSISSCTLYPRPLQRQRN